VVAERPGTFEKLNPGFDGLRGVIVLVPGIPRPLSYQDATDFPFFLVNLGLVELLRLCPEELGVSLACVGFEEFPHLPPKKKASSPEGKRLKFGP
jgi:hypothetical protein